MVLLCCTWMCQMPGPDGTFVPPRLFFLSQVRTWTLAASDDKNRLILRKVDLAVIKMELQRGAVINMWLSRILLFLSVQVHKETHTFVLILVLSKGFKPVRSVGKVTGYRLEGSSGWQNVSGSLASSVEARNAWNASFMALHHKMYLG